MKNEKDIGNLAYLSRIAVILLQYVSNRLITDHQPDVFMYPTNENKSVFRNLTSNLIGGFLRWDAQYFVHISKYGYTYENTLAFFPLYPFIVGHLSEFLFDIFGREQADSIILIISIFLNMYIFKQAAIYLYRLTEVLFNKKIAFDSAFWFCLNPASIFFSAPYTESLFSYLTFFGMLSSIKLYEKYSANSAVFNIKDLAVMIPIGLSTVTRSNGLLNIGFVCYSFVCLYVKKVWFAKNSKLISSALPYGFVIIMATVQCLLPFILYQYYCFKRFCEDFTLSLPTEVVKYAEKNQFVLPGTYTAHKQRWCKSTMPLAYSYVQDHYWNVGFLRYYQFKQFPNFLLASPIIFTLIFFCCKHIHLNIVRRKIYNIFTMENPKTKLKIAKTDLFQPKLNVYYIHALFLSLFCLFFIHIQVSTRLLCSASPVFYWICAKNIDTFKIRPYFGGFLQIYCIFYFVIGTVLFCNYFPWT